MRAFIYNKVISMDATVYYNNLNAISKHNHELFLKLSKITENTNFDVSISQDDPLKINIYDKDSKMWMFKDPINETHRLISGFEDFQKYPLLFFFGFGNGVFLKAILSNKTHERIYIIEPKLEILFIALHFLDFSEDIESKRIRIFLAEDFTYNTIRSLVGNDGVAAYLKTYTLNSTSAYYSKYTNLMVSVNKIIIDAILHFIKSHGNCASDSLLGIDHFLKNIPLMLKNYPFVDVAQRKNSEVAVIVSTGPSLTKQLPLLKEIQKNVTIICVDASMPILEKWGIKPDIVTSLERIEDTALFFEKTSKEFQDGVVFLSSALQHEKIYQNIKGGYLTIAMRPFGYMEIFGLHGYGYIGIGMSAANMAHELAYIMNYSDVILIGQDLAYGDDGLSHAKDHVYGEDEVKGYKTDTYVTKWGGNGKVKTNEVWTMFRGFFVTGIEQSKHQMTTYNCTEGGARIEGSVEMPFEFAITKLIDRSYKKPIIVPQKPDDSTINDLISYTYAQYTKLLDTAKKRKRNVERLFLKVAAFCEEIEELNLKHHADKVNIKKLKKLLYEIDSIKEWQLSLEFRGLFWDLVQSFIVSQELEIAKISVRYTKTEAEQNAKMVEFLFAHKPWLFTLAGGMDSMIEVMKKRKKEIQKAAKQSNL